MLKSMHRKIVKQNNEQPNYNQQPLNNTPSPS